MKKIYSLLFLVFVMYAAIGQVKSPLPVGYIYNNELVFTSQKSNKVANSTVWSNDFSVSSEWSKSNSVGNGQNWVVTTNAPAGIYSNALGIIPSATAANGFALYDSDYIGAAGGSQNAVISLLAPVNLSVANNIELSFQQLFRRYLNEHCYVGISTNGSTWTDIEVNASVPFGTVVSNTVIVDISALADNQANVWIRFHYVGSWDYAWMVDDVEISGTTANAPEIILVNPNSGEQGETLTVDISGQYTHFTQGSETVWFEQASQTIMTGSNVNVQSPTQMSINLNVPLGAPTGMYDVRVENPTDGIVSKWGGFEVLPPTLSPGWTYANTGSYHTILVPSFASLTISGTPLETGDYIGVFFDHNGTLECGGYMIYTGLTYFLSAWGDDPGTGTKDGFAAGEEFTFIIWDASAGLEYFAIPTYETTGFTYTAYYAAGGSSGISSLLGYSQQTQTLLLGQGWGMFSTYIVPPDADIEVVFAPVFSSLVIVKNGVGSVYWPGFGVNLIGDLTIGQGYQINMSAAQSLEITGTAVVPELTPINIPQGWSILGYLRQTPANVETMLSPVVSNVVIVKDEVGSVYWPFWGVNGIGNLKPGEGYQINTNIAFTYTFPANSSNQKSIEFRSEYAPVYFEKVNPTGNNMTLAIPEVAWPIRPAVGDEIGIFSTHGQLVGSAVFMGGNMAVAIWGDDRYSFYEKEGLLPNEKYEIRVYKPANEKEIKYDVRTWIEGNECFKSDGLSVAGQLIEARGTELFQNVPNPCKSGTEISFFLADKTYISLQVYNGLGEFIEEISSGYFTSGVHQMYLNTSSYAAGNYFYTLKIDNFKLTKNLRVIK